MDKFLGPDCFPINIYTTPLTKFNGFYQMAQWYKHLVWCDVNYMYMLQTVLDGLCQLSSIMVIFPLSFLLRILHRFFSLRIYLAHHCQ